jgi:hypothetical protein
MLPGDRLSGFVGLDGEAGGGEVGAEGVVGEGAEAGDDALGVEDWAPAQGGVGVGVAEEGVDGGLGRGRRSGGR